MSTPQFINKGASIRTVVEVKALIEKGDVNRPIKIFDNEIFKFDWSSFTVGRSVSETIKKGDTKVIDISGILVRFLYVETNAPIQINFMQDADSRKVTVSPQTMPDGYFSTVRAPSDAPQFFAPGILVLIGSSITAISLVGIGTDEVLADVTVAFAGLRS